jgi:signal transduction histidine kinase
MVRSTRGRGFSVGRLAIGVVLVFVALFAAQAGVIAIEGGKASAAQQQVRDRLRKAQLAAGELTNSFLDQETGQRGFLLTGRAHFLEPYEAGRPRSVQLQHDLSTLLKGDRESMAALADVREASSAWQRLAAAGIVERSAGPLPRNRLLSVQAIGKARFDELRRDLTHVENRAALLTRGELDRVQRAQQTADRAAAGVLVFALAIGCTSLWLLRRRFTEPLRQLVDDLGSVADGARDRRIASDGPIELVAIAEAAEQMRSNLLLAGQQLSAATERDRLAADLHDLTIQRVFALGMSLSSAAARYPVAASDLDTLVDESDDIIRELRRVIFDLAASEPPSDVVSTVNQILDESTRILGFRPALMLPGIDARVAPDLAADLLAVLREALSNVARHARAKHVTVTLAVQHGTLCLTVADDGSGLTRKAFGGHGTKNVLSRAARRGGFAAVTSLTGGGTQVHYQVPV